MADGVESDDEQKIERKISLKNEGFVRQVLNYVDDGSNIHIGISHDMSVILFANNKDKYVVEKTKLEDNHGRALPEIFGHNI